ncbi:MAG: hypothetical protein WKF30_09380 [Pyrinomonadaceae bacterium]
MAFNQLPLAPLGAGDLIDRSVRLYRRHFVTLLRMAAPPVLVSSVGSVLWALGVRESTRTTSDTELAAYFFVAGIGLLLSIGSNLLFLIVMGGAARNLVAHLLWAEPVSVRSTYRNVRARFWALLAATVLATIFAAVSAGVALVAWIMVFWVAAMIVGLAAIYTPAWLAAMLGVTITIASVLGGLWLFFFLVGRVAYVPQVLLVEGKGVMASLSRSAALAQGNARRLAALAFFSLFATYAALALLAVPLGWYAYVNGIDLLPFMGANHPLWYEISYNALTQASTMLLAPVLIIGLSLLYIDERVRREAYDVELMAMNRLGPMPVLKGNYRVPFAPALVADPAERVDLPPAPPAGSILGLR